jgi:hypothetical protein
MKLARDEMIVGTKHQPACGRPVASFDDLGTKSPDDRKPPGPRLGLTQPQVR